MPPRASRPNDPRGLIGLALVLVLLTGGFGLCLVGGGEPALSRPIGGAVTHAPSAASVGQPASVPIAPPRPVSRGPGPDVGVVNPYQFVTSEPSSLGITDYGVNSAGGGYSYSTPVWWADANISRLLAYYPSPLQGEAYITLQLNVVLKLTAPDSTPFAYWVQNVVSIDTITRGVTYLDNVWNLSSGGSIESGTLSGNGSIGTFGSQYFYGDAPGCQGQSRGYPGNCLTRTYPAIITVRLVTGKYQGVPHVAFQYADGSTWVTYDNVSFPFAANYKDSDFIVDGTQYTPFGLFYDAEWDYTGPSGSTTEDRNSSMVMELQRWNGHNLQAPPNAYNFGSNTGETISNVISTAELNSTNGTVGAQIRTGGGSLTSLYSSPQVGTLNVSTPALSNGTLTVAGDPHPYIGTTAVLTLASGSYNVSLWTGTTFVASALVTITRGVTTYLYLGYATPYPVTFLEQGLAGTATWTLTVGGVVYPDPGPSLALELLNGTYSYGVAPVKGYTLPSYGGNFTVQGAALTIFVNFTVFELPVTFAESGLEAGTNWSVALAGVARSTSGTTIVFEEANGTYLFTVDAGVTYQASPSSSAVTVQGSATFQSIAFSLQPGYLVGQVTPVTAAVFVGGSAEPTFNGQFNISLLPGVYTVEVTAAGYVTNWTNVSIAPAANAPLSVTLRPSSGPGGGGPSTGSGSGVSASTAVLLIGVAAVVAAAVIAGAFVAARRRH